MTTLYLTCGKTCRNSWLRFSAKMDKQTFASLYLLSVFLVLILDGVLPVAKGRDRWERARWRRRLFRERSRLWEDFWITPNYPNP